MWSFYSNQVTLVAPVALVEDVLRLQNASNSHSGRNDFEVCYGKVIRSLRQSKSDLFTESFAYGCVK